MGEIRSRDEAIRVLQSQFDQIQELIEGIPASRLQQRGTIGGGDWSAADLLGHLEAWERLASETIKDWGARQYPSIHTRYAEAGGIDGLNERLLAEREGMDALAVIDQMRRTHQELVSVIASTMDEAWLMPPFYEPPVPTVCLGDAVGKVLGSELGAFMHAEAHMDDLRRFAEGP